MRFFVSLFALFTTLAFADAPTPTPVTTGHVFFRTPTDHSSVKSPIKVVMQVNGLKIRKAGEDANDKTSGHHHLIIDGPAIPSGQVIPTDATHVHFGKGQTETEITLPPGEHTLTLQFADGAHRSYGPAMSATVHVTVVK